VLRAVPLTLETSGIGKRLVEIYLSRPDSVVVAAVRDPLHPTSQCLQGLPKACGTSLIVGRIRSESETDAAVAVEQLRNIHNVTKLDVVVANAGYGGTHALVPVAAASLADMIEHYRINAVGQVVLFGAVLPMLREAAAHRDCKQLPKFVSISSSAGSIGCLGDKAHPMTSYGSSKVALNWLTVKIHSENPDVIAFQIDPG
jgi:norsolorinic acid ketoreductase